MARGFKITVESQLKNMEKQLSGVEWKQHSINNLREITRVIFTRVIIDKLIKIKHFHSTHQEFRSQYGPTITTVPPREPFP